MRNLYEINQELENLIDYETGEILDPEKLEELQFEKGEYIENIALLAKNKASEVTMIDRELIILRNKKKAAENTLSWCKQTLKAELRGKKLKDPAGRFSIYYLDTEKLKVKNFDEIPQKFKREFTREEKEALVDKKGIKLALNHGETIPGVYLEENTSLCIK